MKRECEVCECKITVKNERMGGPKPVSIMTSDEGVFFEYDQDSKTNRGVWFCNDCWRKMLK